ncbi:MAG: hypothetical protein B6247_29570 [Candidatus Parabeggiatoa sp. nov. 2]|nr:MAG: hypothetical protein B6247_29570 [Beggiatoa sp. 4572_84]
MARVQTLVWQSSNFSLAVVQTLVWQSSNLIYKLLILQKLIIYWPIFIFTVLKYVPYNIAPERIRLNLAAVPN